MKRLMPLKDSSGVTIYVEGDTDAAAPAGAGQEMQRVTRGGGPSVAQGDLEQMEKTLQAFANRALAPFRNLAGANVDKVTLEFGLNIGGEAGIPYITSGKVESALKVTVECSFPPPKG